LNLNGVPDRGTGLIYGMPTPSLEAGENVSHCTVTVTVVEAVILALTESVAATENE
jgi:hypothetical protein